MTATNCTTRPPAAKIKKSQIRYETRAQKAYRRIAAEKAAYESRQSQPVKPVKVTGPAPKSPGMPAEQKARLFAALQAIEAGAAS